MGNVPAWRNDSYIYKTENPATNSVSFKNSWQKNVFSIIGISLNNHYIYTIGLKNYIINYLCGYVTLKCH